jgi:hypothetical protein
MIASAVRNASPYNAIGDLAHQAWLLASRIPALPAAVYGEICFGVAIYSEHDVSPGSRGQSKPPASLTNVPQHE